MKKLKFFLLIILISLSFTITTDPGTAAGDTIKSDPDFGDVD
ncbi:hypothetical protein [Virgibacillus halodenitrificans]|jgi:hypothetical protein|nr:hypothetical protein [Virgibacillus halodenitrificans]MEC2158940.1 hypothetical protein [Virgibacillus halodenitrificans]WHX26029.1 hypothetical protein QNH47_18140 [Virgibacillus halodenitrificans]CDQ31525.1 hypothetical protein BN993_00906 [Virgibacillus halodenitrificans]